MYQHRKVEEEEEDDDVFVDKKVSPSIEEVNSTSSAGEKKEERVKKSLLSRFSFRGGRKGGKKVTSTKDFLASVGMEMALLVGIISNEERNLSDIVEESESTNNEIEKKKNDSYQEMSLINRRKLSRQCEIFWHLHIFNLDFHL